MKKTMIVLSALLALIACNKENAQPESTPTVFNITINREDGTKAVKSDWENGDVVYVFFSTVAAPNYVKYTYDGSEWSNVKVGTFDITTNGTMTAIYLPYGNDAVVSADGTSFKFDKTFTSYFLKAEKAAYTVSGATVSGTLNMVAPEGFVQFAMPMSGIINEVETTFFRSDCTYTLSDSNLKPVSFASVAADGSITVTEGAEGAAITGYIYNGDINFSGVLMSAANGHAADYAFNFVDNKGTAETYDDVTYLLSGNKILSYQSAIRFPTIDDSAWTVLESVFPFTVSSDPTQPKVRFSTGNLQAVFAAAGDSFTWQFAEHQWDYVGDAAANTSINGDGSVSAAGTVDLFGWSTPQTRFGIHNSSEDSDYSGDFVDWGSDPRLVSTLGSGWRTLSSDEWVWLLGPSCSPNPGVNCRTSSTVNGTANARFAKAYLFGTTHGLIIFPDVYTHPGDVEPPIGINETGDTSWDENQYNATDWAKMESAGCVFLPAAGNRSGMSVSSVDSYGRYWSSTTYGTISAYYLYFTSSTVNPANRNNRNRGYSVRLVQDLP